MVRTYTIISSNRCNAFKKSTKMGTGNEMFNNTVSSLTGGIASGVGGAIGNELGYSLSRFTGSNQMRQQDQLKQQQKLTDMQKKANSELMNESYGLQKEMWDSTNAEAQVAHYKAAGLNPALMYGGGGGGGSTTGGGSASVGGASASDESSRQAAQTQQTGMGLQMMKLQSEIDVNKSVAERNRAEAGKATEDTTTVKESRNYLIEKLKQEGKGQWLENLQERYKMEASSNEPWAVKNENYGETGITPGGLFTREITTEIAQAEAQANNAGAQALLTNEKAQGYFQELLNDTARSNAAGIQAAASKLSAEFNSGELQNAKFWVQMGSEILKALTGGIIPYKVSK